MLPGSLFTTYKQYKDDTKTIVEWLADTAWRCGYDPNQASQDGESKKPKLKGRARKLARDVAATTTATANSTSGNKTYVVKIKEFVPMAESIARSEDKKVVIPLKILKTFKSCITARGTTNKWYETKAVEDEKEDNLSHQFFIETLKRSLQVLVPVVKLRELDQNRFMLSKAPVQPAKTADGPENRYAHLEIQDIDEKAYEAMADASKPASATPSAASNTTVPHPSKTKYVPEDLDDMNEFHFALACLTSDVTTLQHQLQDFWEQYADGELDLTTVAVTTNTAIEMVKKAEEEFNKVKKPNTGGAYDRMSTSDLWFMECCIRDGLSPRDTRPKKDDQGFFVPMVAWEQAKESYMLLHRLAVIYLKGTTPGLRGRDRIYAITRPAFYGTYNPELDFDDLEPEQQYEQITALLNDMFATVGGYCIIGQHTPNNDMLMQGLLYLQQYQADPPLWFLFACQNFLDIHFTLQTRGERPYEELRDFALSARRTIKDHQQFLRDYTMPNMRPIQGEDEAAVQQTLREIEEWVLEDKMKQILLRAPMFGKTKKRRVWQDFEILRMSPILCGLWKYSFHIQMQWKGITLVNDSGIVAAAHVYNALLQNGYLGSGDEELTWEDMEYLLDLHRAEDTFLGQNRPKSIEDCTKRLALVQGVAPQTFARRRRRGNNHRVLRSRAGSRFLTPSTPVASVFGARYLSGVPNEDWHLEQLDAIVGRRFEKDKNDKIAFNKKINTLVEKLDLDTEDGKIQLLLSCSMLESHADKGTASLENLILIAQISVSDAAFDCCWTEPVQKIIDEETQRLEAMKTHASEQKDPKAPNEEAATSEITGEGHTNSSHSNGKLGVDPNKAVNSMREKQQSSGSSTDTDDETPSTTDEEDDSAEGITMTRREAWNEIAERWEHSKTLPLEIFIDILHDSLQVEYLDIQFDYFAFFRSVLTLMMKVQNRILSLLEPRLLDNDGNASRIMHTPEGAVCVIPQLSLLVACDPLEAPNLLVLRPWLEVDLRPLQITASIMKPWIKEHGDDYCLTEEEREERRAENVTKEGPKVRYIDDGDEDEVEVTEATEPSTSSTTTTKPKPRKTGWSSSVGIMEGLDARGMRQVFDHMKTEGYKGGTVAQTMAKLRGLELDEDDHELIQLREEIAAGKGSESLVDEDDDVESVEGSID